MPIVVNTEFAIRSVGAENLLSRESMSNHLNQTIIAASNCWERLRASLSTPSRIGLSISLLLFLASVTGCNTTAQYADVPQNQMTGTNQMAGTNQMTGTNQAPLEETLQEGDSLRVSFPGAPNLNTEVRIRLDGIISLPVIGEVKAAGRTPTELEQELVKLYGPQLQTKEVSVTVVSSALYLYVTGAVLRPGKITSDHPLTALDAIMEAGGFDYTKANLKKVTVIRHEGGKTQHYLLDLKQVLKHGRQEQTLDVKRGDIIYVPERFAWF